MKLILENNVFANIHADIAVRMVDSSMLEALEERALLERFGFKGKSEESCLLLERGLLFCGVEDFSNDALRQAATTAIRTLWKLQTPRVKFEGFGLERIAALVEGVVLGGYRFERYKSEKSECAIREVVFASTSHEGVLEPYDAMKSRFEAARIVAEATNYTRDLVNATPEEIYPEALAQAARDLAERNDLTCTVLDEAALDAEKMMAMLAVGRASCHQPRLIHLAYTPQNPTKVITLVGKGLTYDSGGLSLKPAASMVTMKMDKAGACAVLGILKAVSELGLPIEVHGFIGVAENMVDANSYKPDDVLRARSGKSIEVRNTDAEGRLVLADVLDYAQSQVQADYLFDYATLTGACVVALGPYTSGVMGHSESLKAAALQAADQSGELVGVLPFNRHLKKLIKSEIADVCNVSSKPYGGAITAGLFLDHFIREEMKQKWLHFDIAGPAYTESAWDCNSYGATGAGVRLTLALLQQL
ncbi:MAG: leucyl aminopeptidase [Campylobacterales bacterium]|nr:leucyl aminopeptidase [Campylobacterales bacterium]